jgi:VIT1/CCC1 family predicted Fe2+/Mn2+ transporter
MPPKVTREELLSAQRNELSEYRTYKWLAGRTRNDRNRQILERIAEDERGHYQVFRRLSQTDVEPSKPKMLWYRLISRALGLSFGLRLMERGEHVTQRVYSRLKAELPELADVILDEQRHEGELLSLIEEEKLQYAGSIVLGLNDALVELTGALAGLTFALQNGRVIAMAGFVTGVAASMSMAASAFLSTREEADEGSSRTPSKSAAYTGVTYIVTVLFLILPYLLLSNVYESLLTMIALSIIIILSYNFYITTAKGVGLWGRFGTMAGMSLAVACISFLVGILARPLFGVDI